MKFAFWTGWLVEVGVALVLTYFFWVGISDGTVSSNNIGIWATLLLGAFGVVALGLMLWKNDRLRVLACALAALPAIGVIFFFVVLVTSSYK